MSRNIFDGLSDDQLRDELARRKEARLPQKPSRIEHPDFSTLIGLCQGYIEIERRADVDMKQYIFEAALEAVFGKEVWTFIRAKQT